MTRHPSGLRRERKRAVGVGWAAEEGDLATGESVRPERLDVGGFAVVFGQEARVRIGRMEQVNVRGREAALAEDGLEVATRERSGVHDGHREADHARAPAAGGWRRGEERRHDEDGGADRA